MNRFSILYKVGYFPLNSIILILLVAKKSKDFQNLVLSKYQNGDEATKVFRDLNGSISPRTNEWWCKAVRDSGSIKSTGSSENHSNKGIHSKDQTWTRATKACLIKENSSSVGYF